MTDFEIALGMVAPAYNLVLAAIALFLFYKFFSLPNRLIYMKPWRVIFVAFLIYLLEEVFTILRIFNILDFPMLVNGIFEMVIIGLFIYVLFLQKEYIQMTYRARKADSILLKRKLTAVKEAKKAKEKAVKKRLPAMKKAKKKAVMKKAKK